MKTKPRKKRLGKSKSVDEPLTYAHLQHTDLTSYNPALSAALNSGLMDDPQFERFRQINLLAWEDRHSFLNSVLNNASQKAVDLVLQNPGEWLPAAMRFLPGWALAQPDISRLLAMLYVAAHHGKAVSGSVAAKASAILRDCLPRRAGGGSVFSKYVPRYFEMELQRITKLLTPDRRLLIRTRLRELDQLSKTAGDQAKRQRLSDAEHRLRVAQHELETLRMLEWAAMKPPLTEAEQYWLERHREKWGTDCKDLPWIYPQDMSEARDGPKDAQAIPDANHAYAVRRTAEAFRLEPPGVRRILLKQAPTVQA